MTVVRGTPAEPIDARFLAQPTQATFTTTSDNSYSQMVAENKGRKLGVLIQFTDTTTGGSREYIRIHAGASAPSSDAPTITLSSSYTSTLAVDNMDVVFIPGQSAIWVKNIAAQASTVEYLEV